MGKNWACTICGTGNGSSNRRVPPRVMVFMKAWTGFLALCPARNRCFLFTRKGTSSSEGDMRMHASIGDSPSVVMNRQQFLLFFVQTWTLRDGTTCQLTIR